MGALRLAYPKRIDEAIPANMASGVTEPEGATLSTAERSDWAPVERTASGVPVLSPAWIAQHSADLRIIDVREHLEFCGPLGHIERAELVPLALLEAACDSWDRNRSIVVACAYGTRSGKAALMLEECGFLEVASLHGGMTRWAEEGRPCIEIMGDRVIEEATPWQAMGI